MSPEKTNPALKPQADKISDKISDKTAITIDVDMLHDLTS
jgi:hypothetical protein